MASLDLQVRTVIAVQNYGSSGSSFLQSLLDSHPQLIAAPHFHARNFFRFWRDADTRDSPSAVDAFIAAHPQWFDPDLIDYTAGLHRLGPERNRTPSVDAAVFREWLLGHLARQPALTRRAFFIGVHLAYNASRPRTCPGPWVDIVYPIHSEPAWVAQALLDDFALARFVHTVRDPRTLFPSYWRHLVHNHVGVALDPLQVTLAVVADRRYAHLGDYELFGEIAYQPALVSSNRARAVRLEDLHRDPASTMRMLARWLDIAWDDCLLESTFDGQTWWNRPERPTASGFDPARTTDGLAALSRFDRLRIRWLTHHRLLAWDYLPGRGHGPAAARLFDCLAGWLGLALPWSRALRLPASRLRCLAALGRWGRWLLSAKAAHEVAIGVSRERMRERWLLWNEGLSAVRRRRGAADKARPAFALVIVDAAAIDPQAVAIDLHDAGERPPSTGEDRLAVRFIDELSDAPQPVSRMLTALGRLLATLESWLAVRRRMARAALRDRQERRLLVPLLTPADLPPPPAAAHGADRCDSRQAGSFA